MMNLVTIFFDNTFDRIIKIFDHILTRIFPYSDDRSIATVGQGFSWMSCLSIPESEKSFDKHSWCDRFITLPIFCIFSFIFLEISFASEEVCMDEKYSFFFFSKTKKLPRMREWEYFFVEDYWSKIAYFLEYTETISDNNNLLMNFSPFSSKENCRSRMWEGRKMQRSRGDSINQKTILTAF